MQCVCKCGSSAREVSWVNNGGGEIAGETVGLRAANPDASRRKRLEFRERRPHGSRMGFKNPFVLAQEIPRWKPTSAVRT